MHASMPADWLFVFSSDCSDFFTKWFHKMVEEDLAMDKMPQVKDSWKQGRNIPYIPSHCNHCLQKAKKHHLIFVLLLLFFTRWCKIFMFAYSVVAKLKKLMKEKQSKGKKVLIVSYINAKDSNGTFLILMRWSSQIRKVCQKFDCFPV